MRWLVMAGLLSCAEAPKSGSKDTASPTEEGLCPVTLVHTTDSDPDGLVVVGLGSGEGVAMERLQPKLWGLTLMLQPGEYPYHFVETHDWSQGQAELWTCDSSAALIHCEEGTAADLGWTHECTQGQQACSSLLVLEPCGGPELGSVQVERDLGSGSAQISLSVLSDNPAVVVEIDGHEATRSESTGMFHVELEALQPGPKTLSVAVDSTPMLTIPLDMDDWSWDQAIIYHAMIDRVANGQSSNDSLEGTSHAITDYAGGDLVGLQASLPYLADLGVNTLWLSNPAAGPQGAWEGDCGATYSGYHGFWPASWDRVDGHLGNKADLHALIEAAHARKMRVILDWVGNHVHQDHPVLAEWPESAVHDQAVCSEAGPDGRSNWDRIPESCWFAPYLPDLDQADPAVLTASVDQAIDWAETYQLDGLRVDAAKHMPHSVSWNLQSRVAERLEHAGTGSDFMLLGETFDGADAINAFIGPDQLDGQFDFPLYWQLREAFITDTASLRDVVQTASSTAERYPGGQMSTFLGNLDVGRFITTAAEHTSDVCPDGSLRQAEAPDWEEPYDRLLMAWTFLLSQPGMPLIYYGDELGLPGYGDPDNRQPLWWTADLMGGDVSSVAEALPDGQARVLLGVKALIAARRAEPALATGSTIEWWADPQDSPSLYAYSRTDGDSGALVIISRWTDETTLSNALNFAGLPAGVVYEDVLSGQTFAADGDSLSVSMQPMSARLLLPRME